MQLRLIAALFASTALLPAAALAQPAGPCDQLLQVKAENRTLTDEQIQEYKANNKTDLCQTALQQIQANDQAAGSQAQADQNQPNGSVKPGEISVTAGKPTVQVQQTAPKITIEQPRTQVSVQQGQPEVTIHQPAPRITIEIPPPQITFNIPKPQVNVTTPEPQVSVNETKPQVQVVSPPKNDNGTVQMQAELAQPIVHYNSEKAQVQVTQPDQAEVTVEQAPGTNGQQQPGGQVAANQDNGTAATNRTTDNQNLATIQQDNQANQAGTGQKIQVSQLKGMNLVGRDGKENVGKVTAVILDADSRPFLIVDENGTKVAVMADYTRLNGDQLVLQGLDDPSKLPAWNPDQMKPGNMQTLSGKQTILIAPAG